MLLDFDSTGLPPPLLPATAITATTPNCQLPQLPTDNCHRTAFAATTANCLLTSLPTADLPNCRLPTANCQLPLLSLRALLVWRRSANALLTSVGNSTITSASTACIKALVVRSVSCQWRLSDSNKWPTSREPAVRSDSTSPCAALSCPFSPLGRLSHGGWVAILRRCIHSHTYYCCHQLR